MAYYLEQVDGAGTGANDEALDDAWVGLPVTINAAVVSGATYLHTLLDKPGDSSAAITNATSASASITPDVGGTLRVRTRTTTSAGAVSYVTRVIRVTKDADGEDLDGGICPTAFGELPAESNYAGNTRGYVERHERNFRNLQNLPDRNVASDGELKPNFWNSITGGDTFTIPDPDDYRGKTLVAYSETGTTSAITCTGTIVGGADANTYNLPATAEGGSVVSFFSPVTGSARWQATGKVSA